MRTFIAIDIQPTLPLQSLFTDLGEHLNGLHLKFSDVFNLHLTLAFLGEPSDQQAKDIISHLNNLQREHSSFSIELMGLGMYAKNTLPQIIWVGVKPSDSLSLLATQIQSAISLENFEPDPRGFSPHITVGRVKFAKPENNLDSFINKYALVELGKISVEKFIFYESRLESKGPVYHPISIFPL